MSMDIKVSKEDQDQYTYNNNGKARRVTTVDSSGTIIDISTESKQDVIISNQTDGDQKTQIVDGAGNVVDDSNPLMIAKGFKIPKYDTFVITRVAIGSNGAGEIETVVYSLSAATVGTVTLSYDSDNKLSGGVLS